MDVGVLQARWVRWMEVLGWTPWQRCEGIEFRGPWVIFWLTATRAAAVPDHIVRGRIEWANVPHDTPAPPT